MDECIFCKVKKENFGIYENDSFFSVPDINPLVDGHTLIISKKHFKTTLDIPNSLGPELLDCIKKTALKLIEDKKGEGFNIVNNNFKSSGQAVHHVHFHIIPRHEGDGVNIL